ncbi:MAG: restriction endonuclease subunit S [Synechococcaceae cyanobacterium SM2_3_2]|nr:restriction endonuclease subunit S [Synechococcaceae cyanobacterium SM2_3_2]
MIEPVKAGYKLTEVGVIPEDWDVKKLCEIAEIRSGIAKNSKISVKEPIPVHYLRVANVQDGFLDLTGINKIEVSGNDIKRYAVLPGDVLMNEGGDLDKLGRGSIWRGEFNPCIHQNHVFVVRSHSCLYPEYLNIWTSGASARRYFLIGGKQTTNLATINKTALGKLPVALPYLLEQYAISNALSDTDALIGSLDRLIAKKRDLKQAAMQQLLTGKTRLPGFTGEWQVKQLGNHLKFLRNGINSRAELTIDDTVKYLHYGDIHASNSAFLSPSALPSLPSSKAHKLSRLCNGDLVFADASEDLDGIGKSVEIDGAFGIELVAGLHTIAIRFDKSILADGFKAYLQFHPRFCEQLRRLVSGTKVYATNRAHIASIEIDLPLIEEQTAIATILSDMDTEIAVLEQRRNKTHALKQGMMQELLTGRIRLIDNREKQQQDIHYANHP